MLPQSYPSATLKPPQCYLKAPAKPRFGKSRKQKAENRNFDRRGLWRAGNQRQPCKSWKSSHLAPFVARILALEFLLDPRVMFAPEAGEVLGDLHRSLAGCQDVQQHRDAAHRDAGRGGDTEELLDAQGDVRRVARFIDHPGSTAIGQGEALRGVLFEELLLGGAQPALYHGLHRLVLKVLPVERAMADLLDQVAAVRVADRREGEFGAPLAEEVEPEGPLFEAIIPFVERQSAGQHLLTQQPGGGVNRGRLDAARADGQVSETELLLGIDALRRGVVEDPWHGCDVLGE